MGNSWDRLQLPSPRRRQFLYVLSLQEDGGGYGGRTGPEGGRISMTQSTL